MLTAEEAGFSGKFRVNANAMTIILGNSSDNPHTSGLRAFKNEHLYWHTPTPDDGPNRLIWQSAEGKIYALHFEELVESKPRRTRRKP